MYRFYLDISRLQRTYFSQNNAIEEVKSPKLLGPFGWCVMFDVFIVEFGIICIRVCTIFFKMATENII